MKIYDTVVVGAGPAGCAAALYIARGGKTVRVFHNGNSALIKAHTIGNYYGAALSGVELYEKGLSQIKSVGAELTNAEVVSCSFDGEYFRTEAGGETLSKTLVIATGASRVKPNIKGIAEYEGKGVSYCAVCDAFFYRKKTVAVLGSGEFARHEYNELKSVVGDVVLLTDGESPSFTSDKLDTRRISRIVGEGGKLTGVEFDDGERLGISGLFVACGVLGGYSLAKRLGAFVDDDGIKVDGKCRTALPGLYAVGDCTHGIKQIAKAVYDGMTAGLDIVSALSGAVKAEAK
ncbi:MAG: NAD(P)/FAD-dependent oxidoreductase [Clostridiales bacterium]|nr:NAD(P)/FAD-dependent oxidoreductase [Clostridiales bacterium]